jgi:hypothetical protein
MQLYANIKKDRAWQVSMWYLEPKWLRYSKDVGTAYTGSKETPLKSKSGPSQTRTATTLPKKVRIELILGHLR